MTSRPLLALCAIASALLCCVASVSAQKAQASAQLPSETAPGRCPDACQDEFTFELATGPSGGFGFAPSYGGVGIVGDFAITAKRWSGTMWMRWSFYDKPFGDTPGGGLGKGTFTLSPSFGPRFPWERGAFHLMLGPALLFDDSGIMDSAVAHGLSPDEQEASSFDLGLMLRTRVHFGQNREAKSWRGRSTGTRRLFVELGYALYPARFSSAFVGTDADLGRPSSAITLTVGSVFRSHPF